MVFREGSWTAHLWRFYLSVSVEKQKAIEIACVANNLHHRYRPPVQHLSKLVLISRRFAGFIEDILTAPQATSSLQRKNVPIVYIEYVVWLSGAMKVKPQPNDRNIPTQHIATLLGAAYCVRLATVWRHAGCYWLKFENGQIWPKTCRNRVAKQAQRLTGA